MLLIFVIILYTKNEVCCKDLGPGKWPTSFMKTRDNAPQAIIITIYEFIFHSQTKEMQSI